MSNEIIQAFEEEFSPMKAEIDKQWFGTFKAGYDACLAQKPNYRYFIREIGEGGWQEVTYSRYAESLGCPHTDYKREQTDSQAALASQAQQEPLKVSENWREPLSADAMQRLKNLGVLDKSPAPEGGDK